MQKVKRVAAFFLLILAFQLLQAKHVFAVEVVEDESNKDLGLAAVWIMNEVTEGGYFKPAFSLSMFDSDPNLMWEIEGGWRFTNWFKFGATLKRTFTKVSTVDSHVTTFGFVAGASGRSPALGNFTVDLNIGSFDTGDLDQANYFIEPGLHIKRHLFKRLYWSAGISYRYVEDQSFSVLGNNSFNSLSVKLGLVGRRY